MKINAEKGLTLLEVIFGITISAVILVILLGALRLGHRSQEKGLERQEISQRMRIVTDRVAWLLRGAYPYSAERPEGEVLYFSGTSRSVGFVTTSVEAPSNELQDRAGLKWVRLFVEKDGGLKTGEMIYFSEHVFEDEYEKIYVLDPTVKSISFEYLDVEPENNREEWVSVWDPLERDSLPAAVRVSIVFRHRGKDVANPPFVAAIRARQRHGPR